MTEQLAIEDFDTAKAVFEKLKDLPIQRTRRILGWVAEGLGISTQPAPVPSTAPVAPVTSMTSTLVPQLPQGAATDIKTFVAAKSPKSDVQFAATVAYYYRFEAPPASRRQTVDGSALQEAARLAARKRLANPSMTLHNAKSLGYLDLATAGEFSINSVGENLVAMTLPGTSDSAAKGKKTKTKSKKRGRRG